MKSGSANATFYFKPGFGPQAPSTPKLHPATSSKIRVVGRTARSSPSSTALYFDWPATTIVARLTGPAFVVLKEASNASHPPNPRHGPTEVANSYWISMHPPCCDWDSSACEPSLSYKDVGGKCVASLGSRLNTTATVTDYDLGLQPGETATVRIEKITEAREDMGGVVEFVGLRAAVLHDIPPAIHPLRRLIECIGDSIMCGAHTERGAPFPDDCDDEYRGNRESSHLRCAHLSSMHVPFCLCSPISICIDLWTNLLHRTSIHRCVCRCLYSAAGAQ